MTLGFYFSPNYLEGDKRNRGRSIKFTKKYTAVKFENCVNALFIAALPSWGETSLVADFSPRLDMA